MSILKDLLKPLAEDGTALTREQAVTVLGEVLSGEASEVETAALVAVLATRGEQAPELAGFVDAMRARSISVPLTDEERGQLVDTCGTGGGGPLTFNISTGAALVAAAAGAKVAKHGNRAITSQAGSADVLEALGVPIELTPEEAARSLKDHHFASFFAPSYHPAFKHISAARKLCAERGQRTIFNFLGPLLNPARPSAQLIGVPRPELCEILARVIQTLGVRRGMVVSGRVGDAWLDELSTLGESTLAEFYQDRGFAASVLSPAHFPLQPATLADLTGGDRGANAGIVRRLLANQDHGPKRDAVLLNAGAALFVAGKTKSVADGWDLAVELIASGRAKAKLDELAVER